LSTVVGEIYKQNGTQMTLTEGIEGV